MELRISSTPAVLGVRTTPARNEIHQEKADQQIHTKQSKVFVETTLPKVKIDQSQCFEESGLKSILSLIRENASYGVSKMYESIGRISEQGTDLSNIQEGGEKIASQALNNAYDQFQVDYNMVTMPRSRPDIKVIEGHNNIRVEGGTVEHTSQAKPVQINYQAGKVEFYMQQQNSLKIDFVPGKFDKTI